MSSSSFFIVPRFVTIFLVFLAISLAIFLCTTRSLSVSYLFVLVFIITLVDHITVSDCQCLLVFLTPYQPRINWFPTGPIVA